MKVDPNAPAYPVLSIDSWNKPHVSGGLTVRQHFAAMAMQGLIAKGCTHGPDGVAMIACEYADTLIAELNKEKA